MTYFVELIDGSLHSLSLVSSIVTPLRDAITFCATASTGESSLVRVPLAVVGCETTHDESNAANVHTLETTMKIILLYIL